MTQPMPDFNGVPALHGIPIVTIEDDAISGFGGEFGFLSNFYPSEFTALMLTAPPMSLSYATVEHWFQANKSCCPDEHADIAAADSPGRAKALGRRARIRDDWEQVKEDVMLEGLRAKFNTHPDLREKLLATGNRQIIETNTWDDMYWGACPVLGTGTLVGLNRLGVLLMQVREEFRDD